MANKKYNVEILEAKGSCNSDLFKKMAERGDITSSKVTDNIEKVVVITGYALCHITVDEKEFDMNYYSTLDGFLSSGSEVFKNSVIDYIDDTNTFKIVKVRTKKGSTYKASPILLENNETIESI